MAKSKTDAQMIARLKREAPEVLEREVDFDALVMRILTIDSDRIDPPRRRPRSQAKPNLQDKGDKQRPNRQH
jgi:hypothetical protein